ncbi:uncharacterized protein LOC128190726 isoform X2 [Crassostrea angulata]|uniref:uncharacterized protein LOC128190726 isoform X2 n=1 Tax=Magallana angulata TaxID=2784310 RepID=UPI0022B19E1C|nr:uncharacterized protein LOC128190726 isoform X2 [Crassostrea angulata]
MKILFFFLLMWTFYFGTDTKRILQEDYDNRPFDKTNTKKWSDKGVVKAIGEVRRIGNSKIVSVTCRLDPTKFGMVKFIMWWVMWWRPKTAKTYGLIAGSFLNDMPVMGRNNLRWEKRNSLVTNLKPHLVCAVENMNSEMYMLQNNTGDYLRMYFIMDKCDPPGVFRCEVLIRTHNSAHREVPIRREFDAETTKEGKVESTCEKNQFKDLARNFMEIYDSLPGFYMDSMEHAFLMPDEEKGDPKKWRSEGGYTKMHAKFIEDKEKNMKYMELTCKVNIRKIKKTVNSVEAFYIFYQPDEEWPNARILLAGLVRSKGMWADPYRVRMFPELRMLLDKHKGMAWRGNSGKGKKATFTIAVPLKLCQTLKGAFQCQAAVEAPNLSKKKITMVRGWLKLRDTPFSTGSKKCRLEKLKGNRTRKSGGHAVIRLVNKKEKKGFSGAGAIVGGICGIIVFGVAGFVGYRLYRKKTQGSEKAKGGGGQGVIPPDAKGREMGAGTVTGTG